MDTDLEKYIVIRSTTSCSLTFLKIMTLSWAFGDYFKKALELQKFPKLLKYLK